MKEEVKNQKPEVRSQDVSGGVQDKGQSAGTANPKSEVAGQCPECAELLHLACECVDAEEGFELSEEVLMHVHSCPECARLMWGVKRVVRVCRSEMPCEMPEDARRRLWEALRKELGCEDR